MTGEAAGNIERIAAPSSAGLERCILAGKPVILTGLFAGQPIREIGSADAAVGRLGGLKLEIRPELSFNGFEAHRTDPRPLRREMTLAGYLRSVRRPGEAPLLCFDQPTPDALLSLLDLGDYGEINLAHGDRLGSRLFVGKAGNASNLHYDADLRVGLLYQVFGRKRVFLISPRESQKLRPAINFSEYLPGSFAPDDRDAFLRFTHAREAVLAPGETLLIPTAFWHHVDYVEDSMSINFGLRRNRYLALLGGGLFHTSYVVQALAARLADTALADGGCGEAFGRLLAIYGDEALDPFARFEAIDALFRELHAAVCPDFPQSPCFASMLGTREADLWRDRLERGSLYGGPAPVRRDAAPAARSR